MKRFLSLLVVLMLCASSGALAAPAYMAMDSNGIDQPIVKEGEKVELNVVIAQAATQGNADQIWLWKYFENVLNVKINVEQVADAAEYRNLALASGDFPDIMINLGVTANEMVTYGQEEKMFLPIDQYIDEYMPNLKAIYAEHPEYKTAITAPDGHIYGLGGVADPEDETRNNALHICSAWLDELNLKMPETLDEFVEVMRAFQTAHPDGIAFSGSYKNNNPCLILLTALGFVTNDAKALSVSLFNGEPVFPFGDRERYAKYLEVMNTLYAEGLMSHDFYTMSSTEVKSYVADSKAGLYTSAPWSANAEVFMNWDTCLPLTSALNDQRVWPAFSSALTCNRWVINAGTKYPELCCKLADFFYSTKGLVLAFYGPMTTDTDILFDMTSGWQWNDQTNWIEYPDILNDKDGRYGGMENTYRQQKIMLFTGVQMGDYRTFFEDVAEYAGADYRRVWSLDSVDFRHYATIVANQKPYYTACYPNNVFFDAATNERVTELRTSINAYVEAEAAKFVTGARAVSEAELANFFDTLDSLDYQEYLQYYKDYYAAYIAK